MPPFFFGKLMNKDSIFYTVSDNYIEYLQKSEPHVMSNKKEERTFHRKYVGILTELNGFKYFVPMSSPKQKDYKNGEIKSDNLTTIYMKSKNKLYGTLRFNCMIPVLELETLLKVVINFQKLEILCNLYNNGATQ